MNALMGARVQIKPGIRICEGGPLIGGWIVTVVEYVTSIHGTALFVDCGEIGLVPLSLREVTVLSEGKVAS
jgi:hypothetical protein